MSALHNVNDMTFLARMMGSPIPPSADPVKWVGAAMQNEQRRAVAIGRIDMLLGNLPTEEDAARTPVESPAAQPQQPIRHLPMSMCACDSGQAFKDCHGSEEYAA